MLHWIGHQDVTLVVTTNVPIDVLIVQCNIKTQVVTLDVT